MATAETSPAPAVGDGASIVLETHRGSRKIPITLHFAAVREARDLAGRPDAETYSLLRGKWNDEGIVLEHAAAGPAADDAVGIFRVQPGGWTSLTIADRKKLKATGLTRGVVLVVRTLAQRPWSATLFTVEPDTAGGEAPLAEFPWDEYMLQNGWLVELAPPNAPPAQQQLVTRRKRSWRWAAAFTLLALAVAGGAAAYRWLPPSWSQPAVDIAAEPAPSTPSASLALKVVRQAQDLEVSWDGDSEPVRQATSGTLTIRSGPATRVIELPSEQLHEARIVFHPLAGVDTVVRLEVLESGGKSLAESVQLLGFDTAPAVTLPVPSARATEPADSVAAGALRKTAPEQSAERKPTPATAGLRKPGAIAPAPLDGRNDPVPVRRVTPDLTGDVIREIRAARGKVTVSVLVSIDNAGKVDDAKVVASTGEPSPSGPYIRLASLSAARQWRFRPATVNGNTVASQMTLLFTF